MNIPLSHYIGLLGKYLRPQWMRVALLAVVLLSGIGLQLVNPQIARYFIDTATQGGTTDQLITAAALFLGIGVFTQMLSVLATYLGENVGWTATNMLRVDLTLHSLRLDMPFHKSHTPGEMIERVDGDVTALSKFFSQFVIQVMGNLMLMAGVLIMLVREDWRVGLVLTVFALGSAWVLNRVRNFAVPAMTAERQAHADLFGFVEERLAGLDDIRANGGGAHAMRGLYRVMRQVYHKGRRVWQVDGIMWSIIISLFTAATVLALGLGAYLFNMGQITLGTVYLFFQYTEMLRNPVEQITDQFREFQRASAGIRRVRQLHDTPAVIQDGPGVTLPAGPLSVEFDRVSFGYDEVDRDRDRDRNIGEDEDRDEDGGGGEEPPMALKDLSFYLPPGRVLGLLGRTGSGKTTVTRLLFRLYDPTEGTVRVGGHDIRLAKIADLRRHIGMVTQEVQLFQATVRDNLTMFDRTVPDERILQIIRELGLHRWYASLPAGLDTELGPGGSGLSAGEAQLLAFARVFLKDPGLVVLDEASARLDPATEQLIERAVGALLKERTGIIIAHRLSTVQRADDILILQDGRILEYGPRRQLLADPSSHFNRLLSIGLEELLV